MRSHYRKALYSLPLVLLGIALFIRAQRPKNVPGIGAPATVIAFSPNGKTLVCASSNDYVQMYLPDQQRWRSFYVPHGGGYFGASANSVVQLRFSNDGKTLFAGGNSLNYNTRYSYSWEVPSRRSRFVFSGASTAAFDVAPDEKNAAIGVYGGLLLLDLKTKVSPKKNDPESRMPNFQPFKSQLIRMVPPSCAVFSPDGTKLAIAGAGTPGFVRLWDVVAKKPIASGQPFGSSAMQPNDAPLRIEWSPQGDRIAAIWMDKISIWDMATQNRLEAPLPAKKVAVPLGVLPTGGAIPPALAWSPDGKTLFSGGDEVREWDASDLRFKRRFGIAGPVAVSPDGKTLATANVPRAGQPNGIWLWKL